jgi:peptidyl-prolyl cis-trans isomerase A (cyclophilin A)
MRTVALATWSVAALSALVLGSGCNTGRPAEPEPRPKESAAPQVASGAAGNKEMGGAGGAVKETGDNSGGANGAMSGGAGKKGSDPLGGKFSLADATKDLPKKGAILATIETSMGKLECKLFDDKAPNTVANFIGLATGKRAWKDPSSNEWVNRPAYDGTTFHRVIKGFMIQGGDPKGNGSGEPGYVIPDEIWEGAKHDRAGLLCMANRGPNTNGAQFFVTDAAAAHLTRAGTYTIFGECAPVDTVHQIANVPTASADRPTTPVTIKSVKISRDPSAK